MNTEPTTTSHSHPDIGDTFVDYEGSARIIAIAEGWVMLRYTYYDRPFVRHCNDLMESDTWQLHCEFCGLPRNAKK